MYKLLSATVLSAAILVGPALAEGEGFDYERNPQAGFFISPQVDAIYIDLPSYEPVALRNGGLAGNPTVGTVELDDGDELGFNGGLTAGFLAGEALGGELWFDVTGQAAYYSSNPGEGLDNPGGGLSYRILPFNGSLVNGANIGGGPIGGVFDIDRSTWIFQGEILARVQFNSNGFRVAPFFGPKVMFIDDRIDTTALGGGGGGGGRYESDENVLSAYYGAKAGVAFDGDFSKRSGWSFALSGGAYYLDGDFDGSQNSAINNGQGTFVTNVSDSNNEFAFGGSLDAGFFFWLGGGRLAVNGGVDYLSDIGEIVAAQRAAGAPATPASLTFDDSISYRGGLEFMIPLN